MVASAIKADLQNLDQRDIDMVHEMVKHQMQRRDNREVHKMTIDSAFGELADVPHHLTWTTGQRFNIANQIRRRLIWKLQTRKSIINSPPIIQLHDTPHQNVHYHNQLDIVDNVPLGVKENAWFCVKLNAAPEATHRCLFLGRQRSMGQASPDQELPSAEDDGRGESDGQW